MIITDLFQYRDMCNVCGQTPCNCTHVAESALKDKADLDAKRQALQQMEREPGHDREAIRQRKLDLEKEARAQGLAEGSQQKGADYSDPPEADYGDDYQDMVSRVKKLAGLGPLKTVYDPKKRVYRNMPTAVQPKK